MAFDTARLMRVAAASPVLERNIVQVAAVDGAVVRYLDEHLGRDPFDTTARPGDVRDVTVTAMGLAGLAGLPNDDVWGLIEDLPEAQRAAVREAVAVTKSRGYALDRGQVHPSVYGLAVPLQGHPGVALGVPMVEVLPEVWSEQSRRYQEVVAALRSAARLFVSADQ